eukprot:TRINITY_DN9947_c0_g1_i3.p1 TRINITY_DN9947_c0_g1~~TRINITY_DN9947_c0_g1_i3.p1  ORF type:complete len:120 (-),score=25.78 TRINITY_DN9947_c0_g1_i3:98-457(-)
MKLRRFFVDHVGGQLLIYVWAMEQEKRSFKQQDVFVPWQMKEHKENTKTPGTKNIIASTSRVTYQRFYHVFVQGELERLFHSLLVEEDNQMGVTLLESGLDHNNWYILVTRQVPCVELK